MNKVTRDFVTRIAQYSGGPALSIYMPTHREPAPLSIQEDQTRFKNLLREGVELWRRQESADMPDALQKRLEALLDDMSFWQQTTEGLAILINAEEVQTVHLPLESEAHVSIGNSFDITPLLVALEYDQPYYLLRIAMHDASLLRGDAYGLQPVEVSFPASPEAALNIDEMFNNSNTVRTNGGPAGASNTTSPHGSGDSNDAGREERLQYFRIIDHTIASCPHYDSSLPLVIAGTDNEAGDYQKISRLPQIVAAHIQGNHSATPLRKLHELAWPIICQQVVDNRHQEAVTRYNQSVSAWKSSDDERAIQAAAGQGRVDTLFVRMIRRTTDSISDAVRGSVPIIAFAPDIERDRVRDLIRQVFIQGGKILGLEPTLMPAKVPVAAIYRY